MKPSNRIFGLDVMRAVGIVIVMLAHGRFMLDDTPLSGFPYLRLIHGVDVFFVLSGFLIGRILLRKIKDPFTWPVMLRFWKRVWFRTLPSYYLILFVNYLVVKYGVIHETIASFDWTFFFFLQNFARPFSGFFWESWSLTVQEWFYVLTPVLLWLALRRLKPTAGYLSVILLLIIGSIGWRLYLTTPVLDDYGFDVSFRKVVLTRLDSIAFGLLAAWVHTRFPFAWRRYKWPALAAGLLLTGVAAYYHTEPNTCFRQVIYLSVAPVGVMFCLPYAESVKTGRGLAAKVITHISLISYAIYLINLALVAEVIRDNFPPAGGWDGLLKYLIFWAVVITASSLFHRCFEEPLTKLRDRV